MRRSLLMLLPALISSQLLLACASLPGSSEPESLPPAPGGSPIVEPELMQAFLESKRFSRVGPSGDYLEFAYHGYFQAVIGGEDMSGTWSVGEGGLLLTPWTIRDFGEYVGPSTGETLQLPLQCLDDRLNIEVAGLQYRYTGQAERYCKDEH